MNSPPRTPESLEDAREIRKGVIEELQKVQAFLGRVSLQHPNRRAAVERAEMLASHARYYREWIRERKDNAVHAVAGSVIPALLNVVDKLLDGERLDDSDHAVLDAAAELEEQRIEALEAARNEARKRAAATVGTSRGVDDGNDQA